MTNSHSDTVRGRRVRMELRRLRRERGLTANEVARKVGLSTSKISRMETGRRALQEDDVAALLGFYAAPRPLRQALLRMLREARTSGWWARGDLHLHADLKFWIELEDESVGMRNYEQLLVPGLLQTEAYARAVLVGSGVPLSEEEIAERVKARLGRQHLLLRHGFRLHVLVHESALRQRIGGREVMREQLLHLAKLAENSAVRLQVVPSGIGAHPGLGSGPFVLLDFVALPSLVHLENKVSSLYMEDTHEVNAYVAAFNEILAAALDPIDSAELIRTTAEECSQ